MTDPPSETPPLSTRDKAMRELQDFNDKLRALSDRGAQQFVDMVQSHQDDADRMRADLEKPMIDYRNTKRLIENLGKATGGAKLSPADLPDNLPPGVTADQIQEALVAYVSHFLGFDGNPSGRLPNDMTTEEVARLMAMPNETTAQLYELIKGEWEGKKPLTQEDVASWVDGRVKDPKYGVASVVSFYNKDDPNKIAPADQKINQLRDILMITRQPETRKKFISFAFDWYRQNAAERHVAQNTPMAVKFTK